jgi:hypothetical protein
MSKQRPVSLMIVLCVAALGLSACQSLSDHPFENLFGTAKTPPPACAAVNDESQLQKLQAENAKLKKQLADAMQDNATLRDLAARKW